MTEENKKQIKTSIANLAPNKGAHKNRTRLGRGIGTGKGKTSGKGHKGQKARSGGGVSEWFEGGAMPLYRKIPKVGFTSIKKATGKNRFNIVNIENLEQHFSDGDTVNLESLQAVGYGTNSFNKAGIKVLSTGELSKKLTVQVSAISEAAKAKIEKAGGTVELI